MTTTNKIQFSGRSKAEAAIHACEQFGITRSELDYTIVSETGEGLERHVIIEASPKSPGKQQSRQPSSAKKKPAASPPPQESNTQDIEKLLPSIEVPQELPPTTQDQPSVSTDSHSPLAQEALHMLTQLLTKARFEASVSVISENPNQIVLDITGSQPKRVIGAHGEVLLSLQFLINRMLLKSDSEQPMIIVDMCNYLQRRQKALEALATTLAKNAITSNKVVKLNPMSSHDRRMIHRTLKEFPGINTRSDGNGLYRTLLLIPAQYS